jgi:hypothetical protein
MVFLHMYVLSVLLLKIRNRKQNVFSSKTSKKLLVWTLALPLQKYYQLNYTMPGFNTKIEKNAARALYFSKLHLQGN